MGERKSMYALKKEGLESHQTWPPTAGYYEVFWSDGFWHPVKIWFAPSLDPVTGEEMDRSPYWHASVSEDEVSIHDVWPECSGRVLTEEVYYNMVLGEME